MDTERAEPESSRPSLEPASGYNAVNKDDQTTLRHWYQSLVVQDPRYSNKFLFKLVALAMGHDETRWRLVNDTQAVLTEARSQMQPAMGTLADRLEGVTVRFWDNTPDTLHIVLPPRAGVTSKFPEHLRNALYSRTSTARESHWGNDNWYNSGNLWDIGDVGDGNKDHFD